MSESDQGTLREAQALRSAAADAVRRGDLPSALALLRRARDVAPRDLETTLLLGDLLRRMGELEEARAVLETAKLLAPADPALAFQLGGIYRAFGQFDSARREFQLVLAQQPEHSASREALVFIELAERNYDAAGAIAEAAPSISVQSELLELICVEATARGDVDAAQTYGRLAFERLPNARTALTLARAEYHAGADADAEKRLQWILAQTEADATVRARAVGTLADIADRRGDYQSAFQQYAASKRELKEAYERSGAGRPGSFLALVERLAASAAQLPDLPPPGMAHHGASGNAGHVFLLGFPRTGTTLLEQCLAGHPDVVTSDEIDALRSAISPYLDEANPFAAFQAAGDANFDTMRQAYLRRIGQRAPALANRVLVDKMPFNSVFAGFVPALFPSARIIFAIRDPRDVVFSCFRRRFGMNNATYEFCTLEGSVRLFCAVMRLSELSRSKFTAPIMECRYEDVVRDLRGTVGRICDFIGVDWREDMARFSERAKRRPLSTVSAPQLSQGLYDGSESWRAYEDFLAPHLSDLAPWISRFGYT
ncbi:MAG: tetratricopeptide repeat-containing sulfotransferase family protein [Caulobacteraceae bacterium]